MSWSCKVKEKQSTDDILKYFFSDLFKKTGFAISGKLSPKETVCMKCHTLFSENKYQIVTLGVVKIKLETIS